jgi:succinate dehydrogenase / fumarate reductase cytochrome b subunit
VRLYQSATGKKFAMAASGVLLMGFIVAHSFGNLKVYQGQSHLDGYAEFLRDMLTPVLPRTVALWVLRLGLTAAVVVHIHAAWGLSRINRHARGNQRYRHPRDYQVATMASRSMAWTGIVVLLFLGYHLANFTWGWLNPGFVRGEVHRNVVASFSNPVVAAWYVAANLALGMHLYHGTWSVFQSLGVNHVRWRLIRRGISLALPVAVTLVNVSIPVAVWTGIVE